ncbi:MAG: beta-propeller fold lactonase family protein, partial [Spirochaetota bacterium]
MGPRQRSLIALVLAVSSLLGCGPSSVIERTTGPAPAGPRARSAADETQAEPSVVLRVSVGCQPKQVVFTPDGSHLVVPLLGDTGVDLVRIADGRVTRLSAGEYDEAKGFVEAIVDPHRGRILVSQMTTARVHAFSYDGAHLRSYPTHGSWSKVVELSPDGRLMVVSNWLSDTLTVLRAEDGTLLHTISVPEARTPRGLAFTPAGETLVIAWFGSGEITFHNTREWSLAARLTTGGACRHVVVHPDRPVAYVSDMARRRVLVVSLETNEIAAS